MAAVELGRREVVAAFLGTASLSCRPSKDSLRPIPGALVDVALQERAHKLSGPILPESTQAPRRCDVAIVGAGAAGLSAAWRLVKAGVRDVCVLELDSVEGGTAQSGASKVSAYPWGAHYLPAPLEATGPVATLLRDMGVLTGVGDDGRPTFLESALIHEPDERHFYRGRWYEGLYVRAGASAEDLRQLQAFESAMAQFAQAKDGKGRKAFAVPVAASSDDAEWTALDSLSMAQWLETKGFSSARLRAYVDYACRDDFGASVQGTSAWAALWYFCARKTGDAASEGFLSWPEGNGRLMAHLSASLPQGALLTNQVVHAVRPLPQGGFDVHAWDDAARQPMRYQARQVVLAVPAHVAARLIEPWKTSPPSFLADFEFAPWVVANLHMKAAPGSRGFPLAWDNVISGSKSLGYVVATHQRLRADATGPSVWTWYCPLVEPDARAERKRLASTSYPDWEAIVRADLAPAHQGFEANVERMDVMRWGHGMIRPKPGFLWGQSRALAAQSPLAGLHLAHSDLGGLALFEEAQHFGVRAAEACLAGLGREVVSWLR